MICRYTLILIFTLYAYSALGHHTLTGSFDESREIAFEIRVEEYQLINPHPFMKGRVLNNAGEEELWEIEMDNLWEMEAVGFDKDTLIPGDLIKVTGYPSKHKAREIFLRSLEHPRLGFLYRHNVRRLFDLDGE